MTKKPAALRDLTHKHFASWLQAHAGASGTQRRRLVVLVRGGTAGGSGDDSSAAADVTQPAAKQSGANEAAVATGGTARLACEARWRSARCRGPGGCHCVARHLAPQTPPPHPSCTPASAPGSCGSSARYPDSRTDDHDDSDGWETESDTEDHDGLGVAATESCDAQTAGFAADRVAIGNVALWRSSMPSIRGFYWHAQAAAKLSGKGKPLRKQGRKRH